MGSALVGGLNVQFVYTLNRFDFFVRKVLLNYCNLTGIEAVAFMQQGLVLVRLVL